MCFLLFLKKKVDKPHAYNWKKFKQHPLEVEAKQSTGKKENKLQTTKR